MVRAFVWLFVLCVVGCTGLEVKPDPIVKTEIREVPVIVRAPCVNASDIPKLPAPLLKPDQQIQQMAAGAAADTLALVAVVDAQAALLRACTKP